MTEVRPHQPRFWVVAAVIATCAFSGQMVAVNGTCGNLIKKINFNHDGMSSKEPYVKDMVGSDWSPYSYLDGFYGDSDTKGKSNKRAFLVKDGGATALEVIYPKGCVTSACAMQVKSILPDVESATLKFKMKFGKDFDWVRGGKLPGLCGGNCLTGCKTVTGEDGWSSRHMWRPCVWPPESSLNTMDCDGGKLVSYVYHMDKQHWCGDDFDFENDKWEAKYPTPNEPNKKANFFPPQPEEWYTIWSYIKMNSAGDPGKGDKHKNDGVLQTWFQVEGSSPVLVVDKQDMAWRKFNDIFIDKFYFSTFFGGSSDSFQAKKDESVMFEDIYVWEGKCEPGSENESADVATGGEWDGMKTDLSEATDLKAELVFSKTFGGGGCGVIEVTNEGNKKCESFSVELNIRPSWGSVLERDGRMSLTGVDVDKVVESAGYWKLSSKSDKGTIFHLSPGETNKQIKLCVKADDIAMFTEQQLLDNIFLHATCNSGALASSSSSSDGGDNNDDEDNRGFSE